MLTEALYSQHHLERYLINMIVNRFTRRSFHSLAVSAILRAAPDRGAYRLKQSEGRWQIVDASGAVVDKPVLAPIPLLPGKEFADVFDPEIQEQIRTRCFSRAKSLQASSELVAYTFTAIPPWNRAWVDWFRAQHADSPGKQQYVQFLKETYSYSIGDANKVYGIDSTSFTDLGQFNWNAAKLEGEKTRTDDEEFLGWIAQALFSTAAEAVRKADPNHLILGQQFAAGDAPKPVLQASAAVIATYNDR